MLDSNTSNNTRRKSIYDSIYGSYINHLEIYRQQYHLQPYQLPHAALYSSMYGFNKVNFDLTPDEEYGLEQLNKKGLDLEYKRMRTIDQHQHAVVYSKKKRSYLILEPLKKPEILVTYSEEDGSITIDQKLSKGKAKADDSNAANRALMIVKQKNELLGENSELPQDMQLALMNDQNEGFKTKKVMRLQKFRLTPEGEYVPTEDPVSLLAITQNSQGETRTYETAPLSLTNGSDSESNPNNALSTQTKKQPEVVIVSWQEFDEDGNPSHRQDKFVPLDEASKKLIKETLEAEKKNLKNGGGHTLLGVNGQQRPQPLPMPLPKIAPVVAQVQEEIKPPVAVNPDLAFLSFLRDRLQKRMDELSSEYVRIPRLFRFFFSGKPAKIEGLQNILEALQNGENLKTDLTVMQALSAITDARKAHKHLNKSHFGSRTVDLLDLLEVECKNHKAADYAKKALEDRANELTAEASKPSCLNLYTARKNNKINGLHAIKLSLTAAVTANDVKEKILGIDAVQSKILKAGVFSHRTEHLLNELTHLEENAAKAMKRNLKHRNKGS